MHTAARAPRFTAPAVRRALRERAGLALLCLCATVAPLAARWIPDLATRIICGVLIASALLAFSLGSGKLASSPQVRELAWAVFAFALAQVLNNSIPRLVGTYVLGESPTGANPLASTISGSVAMQLVETVIAIAPILVLVKLGGLSLDSLYLRRLPSRRWSVFAVGAFVAVYVYIATMPLRPGSPIQQVLPGAANLTIQQVLALTPALLVMVVSNGFQEEVLFRGLFLQRYTLFFGAGVGNVLQAAVFAVAHVDTTYTPLLLVFLLAVVFPLGLLGGYLMRASNGVIVPAILHGAFDILIYLGFLASVI